MKTRVLEYWLPLVVWLIAIFFFSTDTFSAGETSRIVVPVLTYLFPSLLPPEIDFWHAVIRKFGHITEYFILAVLAYRSFKYEQFDQTKVKTIAFVLLTALLDEWHQDFTASRGASIVDVGYDGVGGVWALWLINTYETWRLRSHSFL